MLFTETELPGAFIIGLERHFDERGFFARAFCEQELAAHGLPTHFPQCNLSYNAKRGTLRGMHYEAPPSSECKLVRCVTGAIQDVIIDLRAGSPTFAKWTSVDLSADNAQMLFVPAGFAHGFLTLSAETNVFYHMGDFFKPGSARGTRWNDPRFGVVWQFSPSVISERDANYPDFEPKTAGA
jgi:dTDP-4-dehydrorhamnose 3,5-epimerase